MSLGLFSGLATPWRNTGHYSTLMPLFIFSPLDGHSPSASLLYSVDIRIRVRHSRFNWELPLPPSFLSMYIYLWAAFFLGTRWLHIRSTPSFFQPSPSVRLALTHSHSQVSCCCSLCLSLTGTIRLFGIVYLAFSYSGG